MSNLNELRPIDKVQNIIDKFCFTIGMVPTSYKLSLTYEEQILSIGKYLEETVIPAINNNAEAVFELQNLYIELKNYVDNYFKGLDVQDEIDKKLDEMVENGTLDNIINYKLFNKLEKNTTIQITNMNNKINALNSLNPIAVSSVDEMIDNTKIYLNTTNNKWYYFNNTWLEGGTYQSEVLETDKTLTVENMPADAKITGEFRTDYNQNKNGVELLETDYLNPVINLGCYNRQLQLISTGAFASYNSFEINIDNLYSHILAKFACKSSWESTSCFLDKDNNIIEKIYNENGKEQLYKIPENAVKLLISNGTNYVNVPTIKFKVPQIIRFARLNDINECYYLNTIPNFLINYEGNNIDITIPFGNYYFCFTDGSQKVINNIESKTFNLLNDNSLIFDFLDNSFKIYTWKSPLITFSKSFVVIAHNSKGKIVAGLLNNYINNLNYLYGKKIVAIGDSMVKGHSLTSSQTWLSLIAKRNNMPFINYGINGVNLSYNTSGNYSKEDSTVAKYNEMDNDAEFVVVFSGTNDIQRNLPLGNINSTDITTFYGALNNICNGLQNKYPNKKICFITPYLRPNVAENSKLYSQAIINVCNKFSIPVFNNIINGGINWNNENQLNALTLNDTYHLNEDGMKFVSYKYENFIRSL